jgi:glutathione peroxidase
MAGFHEFRVNGIDGDERSLGDYRGRVCLVVNVASKCGLTPQYAGLQQLYERYRERGLEVLGFPCNQFAGQEPGTDAEVKSFCETRYAVGFPLFSKLEVNGAGRAPVYAWLTSQATEPDGPGDVKWNFAKFLVDGEGRAVARFAPQTGPEAPELIAAIEKALAS